jgi:hypothetical protein
MQKKELHELLKKYDRAVSSTVKEDNLRITLLKSFMESKDIRLLNDNDKISGFALINYLEQYLESKEAVQELFSHHYLTSNNETAIRFAKLGLTTFESLPSELQALIFNATRDEFTQGALFRVSTKFYSLFQVKRHAQRLLRLVEKADYDKVARMIYRNPLLMFEQLGSISPLKYAFNVYDTYMWRLFEVKIKARYPQMLVNFNKELRAQTEHIDLEPLFQAYEKYEAQWNRWDRKEITREELDKEWLTLGQAQRAFLPTHMLREFCREGNTWRPESRFNDPTPPSGAQIYNDTTGHYVILVPHPPLGGLGVDFSLIRCVHSSSTSIGRGLPMPLAEASRNRYVAYDFRTFRRLYEARIEDLVARKSQLDQSSAEPAPSDLVRS